jgi:hypothetical protein
MIVLPQPQSGDLAALNDVLQRLKNERLIETSSSPSALVLDPMRMQANAESSRSHNLAASRQALLDAIAASNLHASAFTETLSVLDALQGGGDRPPTGRSTHRLPAVVVSPRQDDFSRIRRGHCLCENAAASPAPSGTIAELVQTAVPSALVTGWSQAPKPDGLGI